MEALMKFITGLLDILFGPKKTTTGGISMRVISRIPSYGEKGEHVKILQEALNEAGARLVVDGDFGPATKLAVISFQLKMGSAGSGIIGPKTLVALRISVNEEKATAPKDTAIPWYWEAKKSEGKNEADPAFQTKMNPMWAKAGLPQYKGLVGSARAWCALFILANLSWVGYSYKGGNAAAQSWDNFGTKIDWKVNGIPQGAIIRINHTADCKGGKGGNHVTFANGSCSAADLNKSGASVSGFGGNQGNMAKVSSYPVAHICSVTWPTEAGAPPEVKDSVNCSNGKTDANESTR